MGKPGHVVRIQYAKHLLDPTVVAHIIEGMDSTPAAGFGEPLRFCQDLADTVHQDDVCVLVAMSEGALVGYTILDGVDDPGRSHGWVVHFYATDTTARRALWHAARAWFYHRGIRRIRAMNGSKTSDKAWIRVFAGKGYRAKVVGSVIELEDVAWSE